MNLRKERHCFLRSTKGNAILDTLTILIIMIVLSIGAVIGYSQLDVLNDDIQNQTTFSNESKEVSQNLTDKYVPLMDNLYLMAFIMLIIAVVISVFLIDSHPIFFVISFILLIAVFVVAVLVANVYEEFMTDVSFASYANLFTYMHWVNSNLVELMIAVGFLIMGAMYFKFKR